jgi:hypothetical protein
MGTAMQTAQFSAIHYITGKVAPFCTDHYLLQVNITKKAVNIKTIGLIPYMYAMWRILERQFFEQVY